MGIIVTDAQVWSVIGVLAATLASMVIGMFALFSRTIRAEIGGLRGEMAARFDAVDARFDAVNTRLDATDHRIDGLDRDIRLVFDRLWGPQDAP